MFGVGLDAAGMRSKIEGWGSGAIYSGSWVHGLVLVSVDVTRTDLHLYWRCELGLLVGARRSTGVGHQRLSPSSMVRRPGVYCWGRADRSSACG